MKTNLVNMSVRLPADLLKDLARLEKQDQRDKSTIIREALEDYLFNELGEIRKMAVEDFIRGISTEEEFRDVTGLKTIPKDIIEARKHRLTLVAERQEEGE